MGRQLLRHDPSVIDRNGATATEVSAPRGSQLPRLTSLRIFGALAVFLYHSAAWGLGDFFGLANAGYTGVAFFFVLSGFVLSWGTRPGLPAPRFYRRRFARVWPSHFVMLIAAALVPVVAFGRSWPAAVANGFLAQAWFVNDPNIQLGMNGVSWSLSAEAFFYLCFPAGIIILSKMTQRLRVTVVSVALLGEFLLTLAFPAQCYNLPLARFPEFLLGVVAGLAFREGWRPKVPQWVALGLVVVGVAIAHFLPTFTSDSLLALIFLCVVLAAARRDLDNRPGWLRHRALIFAGEVSFAFYLVHQLVIVNLRRVVVSPHEDFLICLLVSLAAALALHVLVERPCNRLLRDRSRSVALQMPGSPSLVQA